MWCVCVCALDTTVTQSHMGRRLSVGPATERTSWFTPPHRKSHGRAVKALPIQRLILSGVRTTANQLAVLTLYLFSRSCCCPLFFAAMLQADDEDDMIEMQMKSPFGSSFRTFNATDYKPIGKASCPHLRTIGRKLQFPKTQYITSVLYQVNAVCALSLFK